MDNDELAERLKQGYDLTFRQFDNGLTRPTDDPKFWQQYASWWVRNGVWDEPT